MSTRPIEPLDPDLADLLRRESEGYPVDAALRDGVLDKVEMAIALGGGGSGPRGSGGAPGQPGGQAGSTATATAGGGAAKATALGKLLAVGIAAFMAGTVVGGAVVTSMMRPAEPPISHLRDAPAPDRGERTAPRPPPSSTINAEGWESVPVPAPIVGSAPGPSAVPSTPASAPSAGQSLARERELLDVAQAALARGRPDDAVHAAERHAERWPHGALSEEREVVLIEALAAAGRRPEAEQRAARFRNAFPGSMLAPAVDVALGVEAGAPKAQ